MVSLPYDNKLEVDNYVMLNKSFPLFMYFIYLFIYFFTKDFVNSILLLLLDKEPVSIF